jgi:glycine oxidase
VRAPVVVNCLGSWANMGGKFPARMPVEPARGQILMFRGPKGLFRRAVMSEAGYAVQRRDGRILVGSTIERAGFEKTLTLEGMQKILTGVLRMSSRLAGCTFVDGWAGFRPLTPDQLPILGPARYPGLYAATGHFRHGILLAPATAVALADLIVDGKSSFDLSAFAWKRFLA